MCVKEKDSQYVRVLRKRWLHRQVLLGIIFQSLAIAITAQLYGRRVSGEDTGAQIDLNHDQGKILLYYRLTKNFSNKIAVQRIYLKS